MCGVGYCDKLRWAVFHPETGKVDHGDIGNAPRSEVLGGGFGYSFSPFWNPSESELVYCLKMADWWRAVQKTREKETGVVHHIGTGSFTGYGRQRRLHRLICDASPDAPPNGFFDCTVEVHLFRYLKTARALILAARSGSLT